MNQSQWKHKTLNEFERSNFLALYHESESQYRLFRLMKSSELTMYCWFLFVMMIGVNATFFVGDNFLRNLLFFCSGIIGLQILFVAAHIKSHALFLEYDKHVPGSQRVMERPIYFYAFYHHHHSLTDNWAPFLAYHDEKNGFILTHEGTRNIIAAHWHGFSMLSSEKTLLIMVFFVMLYPPLTFYFFGYEVGVLLLPLAHGWQHVKKERYGFLLEKLFMVLESIGLVANGHDHGRHHIHTWETVYQDFSSSGLYAKRIDNYINILWNRAFYAPLTTPYDWLKPIVSFIYLFVAIGIPLIFWMVSQCSIW